MANIFISFDTTESLIRNVTWVHHHSNVCQNPVLIVNYHDQLVPVYWRNSAATRGWTPWLQGADTTSAHSVTVKEIHTCKVHIIHWKVFHAKTNSPIKQPVSFFLLSGLKPGSCWYYISASTSDLYIKRYDVYTRQKLLLGYLDVQTLLYITTSLQFGSIALFDCLQNCGSLNHGSAKLSSPQFKESRNMLQL